jgi:Reverse transcriptase (RNA-dependent DNA polymerase)
MQLDKHNDNQVWKDAKIKEIQSLNDYNVFNNLGKGTPFPQGFKKIRCHMIYDVKHDGRHCERLFAGGHLTPIPEGNVYSGFISFRALRFTICLAELNNLQLWGADVSSAYLEAETQEKVCFIAGDKFGEIAGDTLVVCKALYGLQSSGLRWHENFTETFCDLHFFPSKAKPDMWLRLIYFVYYCFYESLRRHKQTINQLFRPQLITCY